MDALAVAQVVTMSLLSGPGRHTPGTGEPWWPRSSAARTVHQATGMVLAQLGVSAREAYLRLQGNAFANDMLLADVAADVDYFNVGDQVLVPTKGAAPCMRCHCGCASSESAC